MIINGLAISMLALMALEMFSNAINTDLILFYAVMFYFFVYAWVILNDRDGKRN